MLPRRGTELVVDDPATAIRGNETAVDDGATALMDEVQLLPALVVVPKEQPAPPAVQQHPLHCLLQPGARGRQLSATQALLQQQHFQQAQASLVIPIQPQPFTLLRQLFQQPVQGPTGGGTRFLSRLDGGFFGGALAIAPLRSEEHTSE